MTVSQVTPTRPMAPLFDMSKAQPIAAPQPKPSAPIFDMSKARPIAATASPSENQEPAAKGPLHQIGGFLQGAYDNVSGAVKGVHDLFQDPQNDDEKAIQEKLSGGLASGADPSLLSRLALGGYRFLHGVNDTVNQMANAGKINDQVTKKSGVLAGAKADLENEPFLGTPTKLAEQGEYGKALGDLLSSVALMRGGAKGAQELPEAAEATRAAIPDAPVIAGTTLPETAGQAASRANPGGIGGDVKGVEDVARKIPGSEGLRSVSSAQQDAAREILANKAREAVPGNQETFSSAPESIEQNATNAAEAARKAGSAKYEEIGKAAQGADFTKPVEAAHAILSDDSLVKLLPKSAREALNKVASSLSEREEIAQQIYGKPFSDLDAAKQAEVSKAMGSTPEPSAGFADILKARSELGSTANSARDAADARQLHLAHEQFGNAAEDSLAAHDAANGTDHATALKDADKTWSQKYAFERFRDGLQQMMRDKPSSGERLIDGSDLQKLINDLDPRGAKGRTDLQRMFPDDPQSVKDLHDLADFMGKNQGGAGGMASSFAKLRILGLKESAIGLIANTVGFSYLLSRPGLARALLTALSAGKNVAKASAAIGAINNAANQSQPANLATPNATSDTSKNQPPADRGFSTPNTIANKGSEESARNASTIPAATSSANAMAASGRNSTIPEGRIPVTAPNGTVYHFPTPEAAEAFKKNAGIQ
jgi:hypothetical protein